jgi:hypothetical protein
MNVKALQFELTGGPYGDETSRYSVNFCEQFTVSDFIRSILTDSSETPNSHGWWGYFYIVDPDTNEPTRVYEYRAGKLYYGKYVSEEVADGFYGRHKNKVVTKLIAEGGWGRMDYFICIEDNE